MRRAPLTDFRWLGKSDAERQDSGDGTSFGSHYSHPSIEYLGAAQPGDEEIELSVGATTSHSASDAKMLGAVHVAAGRGGSLSSRSRGMAVGELVTDVIVIALTLGLVAFVCFVATMNGRDVDSAFPAYQAALSTLGPLFPMIFAFVMGRFLYHLARDKLEKGVSLGLLEQLMGSNTLGSTLHTHLNLRILNLASILLIVSWILSPVGGQAFLRVLDEGTRSSRATVVYRDLQNSSIGQGSLAFPAYFSTLLSPITVKQGPQDPWGNVKIPFLAGGINNTGEGWTDVKNTAVNDRPRSFYSSLVGIPKTNHSAGNVTFALESTYIDLSCSPVVLHTSDDGDDEAPRRNSSFVDTFSDLETPLDNVTFYDLGPMANGSWHGTQHQSSKADWTLAIDGFVGEYWLPMLNNRVPKQYHLGVFESSSGVEARPTHLLFQARTKLEGNRLGVYKSECHVRQLYVESRVRCEQSSGSTVTPQICQVVAQRRSRRPHGPEDVSFLSLPRFFNMVTNDLVQSSMELFIQGDPSLIHLYDPAMASISENNLPSVNDLTRLSTTDFSSGLGQIINSYLTLARLSSSFWYNLWDPDEVDAEDDIVNRSFADDDAMSTDLVYVISWPWWAACTVACVVLAAAGVLGAVFAHKGKSPELLGYTSTILRDSRYVNVPTEQLDRMDGFELSRLMRETRLRYGHLRYQHYDGTAEARTGIGLEENVMSLKDRGVVADPVLNSR